MRVALRIWTGAAVVTALSIGAPVLAQRDPAYQAARTQGVIGEKPDGYLAVVGSGSAAVQALIDDINIRRRAEYTRQAGESTSTVEQMAFVAGCNLIARTTPGEKYQSPDGRWQTRTSAAPTRDARCI